MLDPVIDNRFLLISDQQNGFRKDKLTVDAIKLVSGLIFAFISALFSIAIYKNVGSGLIQSSDFGKKNTVEGFADNIALVVVGKHLEDV